LELVNETGMYESPLPCVIRRLVRPIVAGISLFFRQANLKKYWKRCQWAPTPKYPSHNASNAAICWMMFELRCWSCNPYSKSTPRMNYPAGMEKPRSWSATSETT
jgi:hypothetical protein